MARQDGGGNIPIYVAKPKPKHSSAPRPTTHASTSHSGSSNLGTGGGTKKSSGGGGGGGNPYLASQKKAQSKAAQRYLDQAKAMSGQIAALRNSLSTGFKQALTQRLSNISLVSGQQDDILMEGYNKRLKGLKGAAGDNDASESDASFQNLGNAARERANAVSEAMNNGAGESDVMRSSLMSLRNWDANQGEINRSFYDTQRSINSSLGDLNVDTKTARANIASQANADRDQVWSQYYQQRSESFTNIGNLFGQQSELYGMANEQVGSKKTKGLRNKAVKASDNAFMHASKENATVWKNPGIGSEILGWEGQDDFKGEVNNNRIETVQSVDTPRAKPEGAALRKWSV